MMEKKYLWFLIFIILLQACNYGRQMEYRYSENRGDYRVVPLIYKEKQTGSMLRIHFSHLLSTIDTNSVALPATYMVYLPGKGSRDKIMYRGSLKEASRGLKKFERFAMWSPPSLLGDMYVNYYLKDKVVYEANWRRGKDALIMDMNLGIGDSASHNRDQVYLQGKSFTEGIGEYYLFRQNDSKFAFSPKLGFLWVEEMGSFIGIERWELIKIGGLSPTDFLKEHPDFSFFVDPVPIDSFVRPEK